MSWVIDTPRKLHFEGEHGNIVLSPGGRRALREAVTRPQGSLWLVVSLFVEEAHRGQGQAQVLLATAAQKITSDHGSVWVGLKSDTLRGPLSSSGAARSAWETFCANHDLTRQGKLALFDEDVVWSQG